MWTYFYKSAYRFIVLSQTRTISKEMGRKWKQNQAKKPKAQGTYDNRDNPNYRNYALAPKENEMFEKYYKNQGIIPEGEWDDFMAALRRPLPSTFRITGFRREAHEVLKIIKDEFFPKLVGQEVGGKTLEPPKCLPWYPDQLAWQMNLDRNFIRKSEDLKKFHSFLVSETESGNLSRQEAVSMIPPLLLDVKPHHKVLDLCAAPGSKTAQLIEMLHQDENVQIPDGLVVANDADNKRCYLMVHQVKRLQSPCFLIVNHDASQLPNMRLSKPEDKKVFLNYDRVLADVPCSGDGTMRKNPDVWKKWNTGSAHNLHYLQARILKRGLELLAVGGRLVYSTCSLNPLEDEAVIANMIKKCDGSIVLVDVRDKLPDLKATPGMHSWKIMGRNGSWFEKAEDVPANLVSQIRPSMFPPEPEVAKQMNLDRCLRVLPHHQDTGGFFIAVLQKTKQVPWFGGAGEGTPDPGLAHVASQLTGDSPSEPSAEKPEGEEVKEEEAATGNKEEEETEGTEQPGDKRKRSDEDRRAKKKPKMFGYREDPFIFLKRDDPILKPLLEFFDIDESFPRDQLLVRTKEGKKRNMYLVSRTCKQLTENNEGRVKFINMGLKVFSRSDSKYVDCDFRIAQEGINVAYPYFKARRIHVTKEDVITIMSHEYPFLTNMSTQTREQLNQVPGQGSVIYIYEPDGRPDSPRCRIVLCGWLGKTSCRSFVPKMERAHFLKLCGSELPDHDKYGQLLNKSNNKEKTEKKEDESVDEPAADEDSAGDGRLTADGSTSGGMEVADGETHCDDDKDKDCPSSVDDKSDGVASAEESSKLSSEDSKT